MSGYTCPFCQQIMSCHTGTFSRKCVSFEFHTNLTFPQATYEATNDTIQLDFYRCPACSEISIHLSGIGGKVKHISRPIYPSSLAKQYPTYIPEAIRKDYEEACAIVNDSPKASATLSRRCLQGMIRDFWNIQEPTLYKEIDKLKNLVPANQWKVIDSVRQIGNIGAHMEKDINTIVDIDPDEAQKLIKLIELLLKQWYIERHEQQELYNSINNINTNKQNQR